MARLGAAVNVVTTDGPAGMHGFTASAVCSVTDDPPTLLVCVNRSNDSYAPTIENGVVCVNTLTHEQQALSPLFAGMTDHDAAERFAHGSWSKILTGAPALDNATVAYDCRITDFADVGTHRVLFCTVEAVCLGQADEGLVYYGRAYHRVLPAG
ncbi:MAG: FMN reductase [Acetobacteraceae bacterium]|nr:FMN reductase [Acetobacteraceae bacterium]